MKRRSEIEIDFLTVTGERKTNLNKEYNALKKRVNEIVKDVSVIKNASFPDLKQKK